jgi:hypothetical protein
MAKHRFRDTQFAALPWRIGEGVRREVMLLTSRATQRWIIPKGYGLIVKHAAVRDDLGMMQQIGLLPQVSHAIGDISRPARQL